MADIAVIEVRVPGIQGPVGPPGPTSPFSSQTQAEGGSNNTTAMSPLRTKQQIDARVADQATATAGTDNAALMTPLRTREHGDLRYLRLDGSAPMDGDLDMGGGRLTEVGNATADLDALNRITGDGRYARLATGVIAPRADVASATTTDIGAAASQYVRITGTTTITSLGTADAGVVRDVLFADALTLTHNATSLILPGGANITTVAGDTALFRSEGSGNWRCIRYTRAAARPDPIQIGSTVSVSGTAVDFTGIPAGVKRVRVLLTDVGTNGSSSVIIQIGTSGGFVDTGYNGTVGITQSSSALTISASASGFQIVSANSTASRSGELTLSLLDPSINLWVANGSIGDRTNANMGVTNGYQQLSGPLERLRLRAVNGTDSFDSGLVSISWEF